MDRTPHQLKPVTGILDLRSSPESIIGGGLRWRENWMAVSKTELRRRPLWSKFLSQSSYNNQDLHDQLLSLRSTFKVRQPITLLFPVVATDRSRYLFAATESTIYQLKESTGNWKIISDGYGRGKTDSTGRRFYATNVGDIVVFSNGLDKPFYYPIGQPPDEDTGDLVYNFDELDLIGVTSANVVWSWKSVLFFGDIEQDGSRHSYRIIWSDFQNPTGFDPATDSSISGTFDLEFNERILAAAPMGDVLLLYTTHAIWRVTPVDDERTFTFKCLYRDDKNRTGCLAYRNTLVSNGDVHFYASSDDIYVFNQFYQRPQQPDWVHHSTGKMFDNIDSSFCDYAVAEYSPDKEIVMSYPVIGGNGLPAQTIFLNDQYNCVDYGNYGFTALANYQPFTLMTLRQFIVNNGICTEANLIADGYTYAGEGLPNITPPAPAFTPDSFFSDDTVNMGIKATDTLVVIALPSDGQTITINGKVYTAKTTLTNTNGYVLIGTTVIEFLSNLKAAVNLEAGAGTKYAASTTLHPTVTCTGNTNYFGYFEAKTAGTAGNSLTATETLTGGNWTASTFSGGQDIIVEDVDGDQSATSLCALLDGFSFSEYCREACPSNVLFIGVSSVDWCIKTIGGVFYQEECANPTAVGSNVTNGYQTATASYTLNGYDSIIRMAPAFSDKGKMLRSNKFTMDYIAVPANTPANVVLRVGQSAQLSDPNDDSCVLKWKTFSTKLLKCLSTVSATTHTTNNTQPAYTETWAFEMEAPFLYYEITVSGVGGDAKLSSLTAHVTPKEVRNR